MKKRIAALAMACVMVLGTVAAAAGVEKTITVSPMALTVDGQSVTPQKSDGTAAEVFSYEGATYAPVRYLSELLGLQVEWDRNDPSTAKLSTASNYTYADTIAWDGAYDVVVVGFGGAGAVAAKTAADENANVLVVEKAPMGEEGGNTRLCGQFLAYGNDDYDATLAYYKALQGNRDYNEASLEVYAKGIAGMKTLMAESFGTDPGKWMDWSIIPLLASMSPEYPELPGSDKIALCTVIPGTGDQHLWKLLRQSVVDRADKIDVWFESPAVHLIQDPESKTIIGVQVEREGKTLNIRANNGVVMACGGFENNPEMVETYLGLPASAAIGTLYNTGDGHRMAMEVGADMWHMDVYEGDGIGYFGGMSFLVEEGQRAISAHGQGGAYGPAVANGSVMLLAADGSRYLREDENMRHGHIYQGGTWDNPKRPTRSFLFFDEAQVQLIRETLPQEALDSMVSASTLAELAEKTGMDADILSQTISDFNRSVKNGRDEKFDRSVDTMRAVAGKGPYYAIELIPAILNTQGGARRNENAEILGNNGEPIPHLYSAGEFGGITSFMYQGGGNMAECIIFGQIAGKNAAAEKEALPACKVQRKVVSTPQYTIGVENDIISEGPDVTLGSNEYLGVSHNAMGGDLYVKVTLDSGKIAKVEVLDNKETAGIGDKAIAALPDAIVKAGSTEVDNVSGATITSQAIKEAVTDALSQVN